MRGVGDIGLLDRAVVMVKRIHQVIDILNPTSPHPLVVIVLLLLLHNLRESEHGVRSQSSLSEPRAIGVEPQASLHAQIPKVDSVLLEASDSC